MVWAVSVSLAATQEIARTFFLPVMAPATTRVSRQKESSVYCFLFLQVLRCFTSLGAPSHTRVPADDRRVSPFGNFRIKGYLAPPRNLSQPYHVLHRFLKPRHPPYTLRSHRERCTPHVQFLSVCLAPFFLKEKTAPGLFVYRGRKDPVQILHHLNPIDGYLLPSTTFCCALHK